MDGSARDVGARGPGLNLVLWILPPVVAASAVALAVAMRSMAEEAERLRRDVGELRGLRLAVVELRTETERAREALARTRLR